MHIHISEQFFQEEIENIKKHLEATERLHQVNSELLKYNWVFLHPYSYNFDVHVLAKYAESKSEDEIFSFFAKRFLTLKTTIGFLEGFYKKRPFLKDYGDSIEQSIVLCLQKDFSGAINVLLPTIEGTLRKYLITKKGNVASSITNISELLKAFDYMTDDYLGLQEEYLNIRFNHLYEKGEFFTTEQLQVIRELHFNYFTIWVGQLKNYLKNNLYCSTRNGTPPDPFNRHILFHALAENIEYSFKNYLRLMNCINFLSWAIGSITKGCSPFVEAKEEDVKIKWVEYLKILIASEALGESKSRIYKTEIQSFKPYLSKNYVDLISISEPRLKNILKMNEIFKTYSSE